MNSKVAVIIRTKNREVFLRRSIQNVLEQSFTDWQIIVVNDGGVIEDVVKVLDTFSIEEDKLLVFHRPASEGMEAASNFGITHSKSKYIAIHDDDDSWDSQFLEKCVGFLEKQGNERVKGVITYTSEVFEHQESDLIVVDRVLPLNNHIEYVAISKMVVENLFPPISFLYKRDVYEEISGYDESLPVLGDWDFNLKFILKYDIGVIPELLAFYHIRKGLVSGEASNSVIAGADLHKRYKEILKNRYLREDIKNGKIGIGYYTNSYAASQEILEILRLNKRGLRFFTYISNTIIFILKMTGIYYVFKLTKRIFKK
jgi:glycosyltransferase involved in cell wall biosynthesis